LAASLILPHGGKLIHKYIEKNYDDLKSFEVSTDIRNDAENIATGVFSPLKVL
jgi:sulfate adenylyltransferase